MSRAETVELVRRAAGRRVKAKGRRRKVTSRSIRTPSARVTIELRKGEGLAALDDARAALAGEMEGRAAA